MKFQIGEIVVKRKGCGLINESLFCRIVDTTAIPCFICDDTNCDELANVLVLTNGKPDGYLPHISECALELVDTGYLSQPKEAKT